MPGITAGRAPCFRTRSLVRKELRRLQRLRCRKHRFSATCFPKASKCQYVFAGGPPVTTLAGPVETAHAPRRAAACANAAAARQPPRVHLARTLNASKWQRQRRARAWQHPDACLQHWSPSLQHWPTTPDLCEVCFKFALERHGDSNSKSRGSSIGLCQQFRAKDCSTGNLASAVAGALKSFGQRFDSASRELYFVMSSEQNITKLSCRASVAREAAAKHGAFVRYVPPWTSASAVQAGAVSRIKAE